VKKISSNLRFISYPAMLLNRAPLNMCKIGTWGGLKHDLFTESVV